MSRVAIACGALFGAMIVSALPAAAAAGNILYAADNVFFGAAVVDFNAGDFSVADAFNIGGEIRGLATDGSKVFVSVDTGISVYSATTDALLYSIPNSGPDNFGALALSNGILYAADNVFFGAAVVDFNAADLSVVDAFHIGGDIRGLATDGSKVFVSLNTGISVYSATTDALLYSIPNSGPDNFGALALSGGILYAADNVFFGAAVVDFNAADLSVVDAFHIGGDIRGLATDGSTVFVSLDTGLSAYSATTDALLYSIPNSGPDNFGQLALSVGRTSTGGVPEPTTWALLITGFGAVGSALRASRRRLTPLGPRPL